MKRYVFDIETNGFLDVSNTIHSLAIKDPDTGVEHSFTDHSPMYLPIKAGLQMLLEADEIIGHNILGFDIPAIQKVYPRWKPKGKVTDTLVLSRVAFPDITQMIDAPSKRIPPKLWGSHSLKAWGARLGNDKGDFEGPWDTWTPEMHDYCIQDVAVNTELYWFLMDELGSWQDAEKTKSVLENEHKVATICLEMEWEGWPLDLDKAAVLLDRLRDRQEELLEQLQEAFPPWEQVKDVFVPKRDNSSKGYIKGVPIERFETITFNPGSRKHIAFKLSEKYGWKPKAKTEKGEPKVDETVLNGLDYPEAALLSEYFVIQKRLGQLIDGNNGWLKKVDLDGHLHPRYNTNGAATGRATHMSPNIAQVPGVRSPYGKECREIFSVPDPWGIIGTDQSGIELRCLAHYLYPYDGGAYARIVLEGDIHTANQEAAGLPTRDMAKTFIYAWLYGAGPAKLGEIVGGGYAEGKKLQEAFLKAFPQIAQLKADVVAQAEQRGYLYGLDGRKLFIRSPHSALNTLLQSAGAITAKGWLVQAYEDLHNEGYFHGWQGNMVFLAWVHDEIQIAFRGDEEDNGRRSDIIRGAAKEAGEQLGFRLPIDTEANYGRNWADTH